MGGWHRKLTASMSKELKVLARDRAGMVLLFVMPLFLVVAITTIQDKVTKATVDLLFIDQDQGVIGQEVQRLVAGHETIRLVSAIDGEPVPVERARELVGDGSYQFALVVPSGASEALSGKVASMVRAHLLPSKKGVANPTLAPVLLWFDPTVHGSFRAAVKVAVMQAVRAAEARLVIDETLRVFPEKLGAQLPAGMIADGSVLELHSEELMPQLFSQETLQPVTERFASSMGFVKQPTAVQQNVPAWTIFGIFFIVVPLAGSLITERNNGTLSRLKTMPVSYLTVMAGKISAFAMIACCQFLLILAVGVYGFPYLGLAAFDPGTHFGLLLVMLLAIISAACGYGILLGTLGRTYEQVAVFGPVSIVIGAAIGGIMVPAYALPDYLRPLCLLSPLYWSQSGFYDLILRDGQAGSIAGEAGGLFIFAAVCIMIAFFGSGRKKTIY